MANKKKKKDELDKHRNRGILLEGKSKVSSAITNALIEGYNSAIDLTGYITDLSPEQKKVLKKAKFKKNYAYGGRVAKYKD